MSHTLTERRELLEQYVGMRVRLRATVCREGRRWSDVARRELPTTLLSHLYVEGRHVSQHCWLSGQHLLRRHGLAPGMRIDADVLVIAYEHLDPVSLRRVPRYAVADARDVVAIGPACVIEETRTLVLTHGWQAVADAVAALHQE